MVLTPHLLIGAAIGAKTHNLGLIVILGILSHVVLDKLPHWDYANPGISCFKKTKDYKRLFVDLLKIATDGFVGSLVTFLVILKTNQFDSWKFILLGIFFSILPDIFLFSSQVFGSENFSKKFKSFHYKFFHGPKTEKEGKITFLGLATEILVIMLAFLVFFS